MAQGLNQQLDRGTRSKCEHHLAELRHEQGSSRARDDAALAAGELRSSDHHGRDRRQQIVVAGYRRGAADEAGEQHSGGGEAHAGRDVRADLIAHDGNAGRQRGTGTHADGDEATAERRPLGQHPRRQPRRATANSTLAGTPRTSGRGRSPP